MYLLYSFLHICGFPLPNAPNILLCLNPIALRKDKIEYNFGISECNRVKRQTNTMDFIKVILDRKKILQPNYTRMI